MAKNIYRSFKGLNGKTLRYGDIIYFGKLKYTVHSSFLNCISDPMNTAVFSRLKLSEGNILFLLTDAYGYDPEGGDWPECKSGDYEALTRASLMVYALMDKDPYIEIQFGKKFKTINLKDRPKEFSVKLNSDYTARLGHKSILVGCQRIPYTSLESLIRAAHKAGYINVDLLK